MKFRDFINDQRQRTLLAKQHPARTRDEIDDTMSLYQPDHGTEDEQLANNLGRSGSYDPTSMWDRLIDTQSSPSNYISTQDSPIGKNIITPTTPVAQSQPKKRFDFDWDDKPNITTPVAQSQPKKHFDLNFDMIAKPSYMRTPEEQKESQRSTVYLNDLVNRWSKAKTPEEKAQLETEFEMYQQKLNDAQARYKVELNARNNTPEAKARWAEYQRKSKIRSEKIKIARSTSAEKNGYNSGLSADSQGQYPLDKATWHHRRVAKNDWLKGFTRAWAEKYPTVPMPEIDMKTVGNRFANPTSL